MVTTAHWSNVSMVFYIVLGLYAVFTLTKIKQKERQTQTPPTLWNGYLLTFTGVLTVLAAYRVVNSYLGGWDAPAYIAVFEISNDPVWRFNDFLLHMDKLFLWCMKAVRFFTPDYHVFFLVMYGVMTFAYMAFMVEFSPKRSNYIPCLLLIFLYWRSLSSMRSNFAIAVFMIGLILLNRKYVKTAIVVMLSTIFIHKMSVVFCAFIPFYYVFGQRKMKVWHVVGMVALAYVGGVILKDYVMQYIGDMELQGAYAHYMEKAGRNTFFGGGAWKIAFEQIVLGIAMAVYYRAMRARMDAMDEIDKNRMEIILSLCILDMILIPANYVLGIWRGVQFFYLPRLVMWGEILTLWEVAHPSMKRYGTWGFYGIFIAWMWFRFSHMWEDSNLMPYVFEPLVNF